MTYQHDIGRRILIPLDGSALANLALLRATALATPHAHLILFRAVLVADANTTTGASDTPTATALATARHYLEGVAGQLSMSAPDLQVEIVAATGDPVKEIIKTVRRLEVDTIVMASFGQGGIRHWTFGSVAGNVVHKVGVPVLIVRPDDRTKTNDGTFRRIVVPLDGSARAEQSLPTARSLALRLGIPVTLVTVLDPVQAGLPDNGRASLASEQWHELRIHAQMRAQQALSRATAALSRDGITVNPELIEGPVVDCLRETVRPDDIIVLTSRTGEGEVPWEEESVAKQIIRMVPVPLLLARVRRPADLVAPVSDELEPTFTNH